MVKRIGVKSIFILIGLEKAMAKYKSYDYAQRVMIPVSLEEQLVPGTLEFAIQTLVEDRMDMAVFEDRYQNDETGRLAYDPKILLKVVLLGYARGLITSRKMEQACRENVTFMALACGQRRITARLQRLFPQWRGRYYLFFGMFCWFVRRAICWGGRFLRWMGASFLRMLPRIGAERSRI